MSLRLYSVFYILFFMSISYSNAQSNNKEQEERDKFEKKFKEEHDERINTFVSLLNTDDFQKEIIKQKIWSYYPKKKVIMTANLKYQEQEEQLRILDETHFADLKNIVSDDIMKSILSFTKDYNSELKKQKKKKNN